jgi:nucleotide-binding universal stress UspA family protein
MSHGFHQYDEKGRGRQMYQKILVPLDESKESECVIDHVRVIAKGCSVPKVVLLRVVEPFPPAAANYLGDDKVVAAQKAAWRAAEEYLSYVSAGLKNSCGGIEQVVVEGNPADEILDYAKTHDIDLIAMTTHGRSGIARWSLGSVTERVMRHATVPVLTVAPAGCRP